MAAVSKPWSDTSFLWVRIPAQSSIFNNKFTVLSNFFRKILSEKDGLVWTKKSESIRCRCTQWIHYYQISEIHGLLQSDSWNITMWNDGKGITHTTASTMASIASIASEATISAAPLWSHQHFSRPNIETMLDRTLVQWNMVTLKPLSLKRNSHRWA